MPGIHSTLDKLVHSFNKYLVRAHYMPGTRSTAINKTDVGLVHVKRVLTRREETKMKKQAF